MAETQVIKPFFNNLGLGEVIDKEQSRTGLWELWSSLVLTKTAVETDIYKLEDIIEEWDIIQRLTKGKKMACILDARLVKKTTRDATSIFKSPPFLKQFYLFVALGNSGKNISKTFNFVMNIWRKRSKAFPHLFLTSSEIEAVDYIKEHLQFPPAKIPYNLTDQQRKILLMWLAEKSNVEIGKELDLDSRTVSKYLNTILGYFNTKNHCEIFGMLFYSVALGLEIPGFKNYMDREKLTSLIKDELLPQEWKEIDFHEIGKD